MTSNLRDFPIELLADSGLQAIHPDDFIINLLDLDPYPALSAFKDMRSRLRKPPMTAEAFVNAMERNQLFSTAARLQEAIGLI